MNLMTDEEVVALYCGLKYCNCSPHDGNCRVTLDLYIDSISYCTEDRSAAL